MPRDRVADPWGGATYHGFSGMAEPRPPPTRGRMPALSRKLVIGGVAVAVGLGLVFGLAARPDIGQREGKAAPMPPAAQAPSETIPIEVTKPVLLPTPKPTTRLEVLPPDMARRAPPPAALDPSRLEPAAVIEPDGRDLDEAVAGDPEEIPDDAPG
jgi:hypothetical protein